MEKQLDEVEEGQLRWKKVLEDFYAGFHQEMLDAEEALNRGLDFEYNNAIYAVMDALYLDDQSAGKTSETVADWSVSYSQSTNGTGAAVYDAARPWLVDTGLLYRGCD